VDRSLGLRGARAAEKENRDKVKAF
jgi:hypothetical protein